MSDTVLIGVLRMPPELWSNDIIDVQQRYSRYLEAADRLDGNQTPYGYHITCPGFDHFTKNKSVANSYLDVITERGGRIIPLYEKP